MSEDTTANCTDWMSVMSCKGNYKYYWFFVMSDKTVGLWS